MPKKAGARKATFGGELIEGMKLVLAHQRGKVELEQVWPKPIDVKTIRKRVKMSQAEFSDDEKRKVQEKLETRAIIYLTEKEQCNLGPTVRAPGIFPRVRPQGLAK